MAATYHSGSRSFLRRSGHINGLEGDDFLLALLLNLRKHNPEFGTACSCIDDSGTHRMLRQTTRTCRNLHHSDPLKAHTSTCICSLLDERWEFMKFVRECCLCHCSTHAVSKQQRHVEHLRSCPRCTPRLLMKRASNAPRRLSERILLHVTIQRSAVPTFAPLLGKTPGALPNMLTSPTN